MLPLPGTSLVDVSFVVAAAVSFFFNLWQMEFWLSKIHNDSLSH
jgi:hypothetical protein